MALIQTDPNRQGNGLTNTLQSGVRKDCPVYKPASTQPRDPEFSTHWLPKAFLHSLRTLFDILDDEGRGFVQLSEIESRWRGAEERDVPAGVLEGLRRVASRHGCLSFERFVAGLRYSMFNPEINSKTLANNPRQQQNPPERSRTGTGRPLECRVRPLGPSNGIKTVHTRNRPDKHSYPSRYSVRSDPVHTEHHGRSTEPASESPDGLNTVESLVLLRSHSESTTGFRSSRRHARDHPRRHTITSGVDYGMEFSAESCQSRMDVLLPKLQEITRCLSDLISFSGKTVSSSDSLSAGISSNTAPPQAIHTLKEHNRLLTQEVTEKSERITKLEQEKSALIKQLFEARARNAHDSSALDSTSSSSSSSSSLLQRPAQHHCSLRHHHHHHHHHHSSRDQPNTTVHFEPNHAFRQSLHVFQCNLNTMPEKQQLSLYQPLQLELLVILTASSSQLRLHAHNTSNKQNNKLDSSAGHSDGMNDRVGVEAAFKVHYTFLLDSRCE
ncbi:suppressor APC domain-containing protein 2 isoform X2 [Siphateles boraxobius]|uniref:suppressor APC domain-containing protein 2 isoform X2 n=1 Tax=Siphateles boraxobius TaxID=180520 RepID=UPI00406488C9